MKKRLIIGLIIGATVFATVFAFAASLTVDGDNLQAGANANDLACDADGVNVSWTVAFQSGQYEVTEVTVGGINTTATTGCGNHDISVTLEHTGGPTTVEDNAYANAGATTIAVPAGVSAEELSTGDVNVAITE
jgi:hypothetical protein